MSPLRNTTPSSLRARLTHRTASLATLGAVALTSFAVACADAPSAPAAPFEPGAAPSRAVSTVYATPVAVKTLQRTTPLARSITASITLNNTGGSLRLTEAGLNVNIPKTALPYTDRPITITVTALAGSQVAYEFGPSGTKFKAPLNVTQELTGTTWAGNTGSTMLSAEYFKGTGDLSPSTGTAWSYESLPATVMATGNRLHWDVLHFSGYMVSTGRR
jgi:hypothetical protein